MQMQNDEDAKIVRTGANSGGRPPPEPLVFHPIVVVNAKVVGSTANEDEGRPELLTSWSIALVDSTPIR